MEHNEHDIHTESPNSQSESTLSDLLSKRLTLIQ